MTALRGIRVLELAEGVAGEYCGKLLADFGAEVIKVEKPGTGSPTRYMAPMVEGGNRTESSGLFAYLNTGKHSLALDLYSSSGAQTLEQLLSHVDAVIDDHSAGWLAQVGLDAASVEKNRPDLVVCAITPYGLDDDYAAEDINVFHSSGWGYHTPSGADNTRPPLKGPGRFLVSYEAALDAALCVTAALYNRLAGGTGQFIDISKQAVMASRIDYVLSPMIGGDMPVNRDRKAFDLAGPSGIFPCEDGYVYIWMSAPAHWQAIGELMGSPSWMAGFPDNWLERGCTPERVARVREEISAWLASLRKHEISARAQKRGLTMVPLNNTPDLLENPQFKFRQFFREVDHPVLGTATYPSVPYKLSETPARIAAAAPTLGQHTADKLASVKTAGGES